MKTFLFALLFSFGQPAHPTQPIALLQEFVRDVVSQQVTDTDLEVKYLCPTLLQQQSATGDKARATVGNYFLQLKKHLREHQVKAEEVRFTPFDSLPTKPFEIIGGSSQVYVAQYQGETICYFLVEDNKISSFLLLETGLRAFFITFCK